MIGDVVATDKSYSSPDWRVHQVSNGENVIELNDEIPVKANVTRHTVEDLSNDSAHKHSTTDPIPGAQSDWMLGRNRTTGFLLSALVMGGLFFGIPLGVALHREKLRYSNLMNKVSSSKPVAQQDFPPSNITVAAFYYPWYTGHFLEYLRDKLDPPQLPQLGPYNQQNPNVISQHLAWSRQSNVGVWMTSWWGQSSMEDSVIKNNILTNSNLGNHRIALLYETMALVPQSSLNGVLDDIHYIAETYFGHPNYYRINNKPVIFIYLARVLNKEGILKDFIYLLRSGAAQMGYEEIYIIGDIVFGDPPASSDNSSNGWYEPFFLLDAVGTYDVYGSIGATGYVGQTAIDSFAQRQRAWRTAAHRQGCAFIPGVSPGFNDRGVRSGHEPAARQLEDGAEEGSMFRAVLKMSLNLVEVNHNMTGSLLFVTSWNEWHEDTQIEPVVAALESTINPFNLTAGLKYNAYGETYLEILREATRKY